MSGWVTAHGSAVFLAVTAATLASAPAAAETAYELYLDCQAETGSFRNGYCLGFVAGVGAFAPYNCPPQTPQVRQIIMIFKNWAARHPEMLHEEASLGVATALYAAFPCTTPNSQPHVSKIPAPAQPAPR